MNLSLDLGTKAFGKMIGILSRIGPTIVILMCIIQYGYDFGGLISATSAIAATDLSPTYSELPIRPATVAVIYTGDLRGWVNFVDNNIEYLFNHIAHNCTVHVYMMPKVARQASNPTTVVELGNALTKIRPYLRYFVLQEADFKWDDFIQPPVGCAPPLLPSNPEEGFGLCFYQQFISLHRVYQEVVRQEVQNGWRYEWYGRSRMDVRWTQIPSFNLTTASTDRIHVAKSVFVDYEQAGSISDHFAVMHANVAEPYMTVADKMFQGRWCRNVSDFNPYCHVKNDPNVPPECLLARWLVDHAIQWEGHAFSFEVQSGQF